MKNWFLIFLVLVSHGAYGRSIPQTTSNDSSLLRLDQMVQMHNERIRRIDSLTNTLRLENSFIAKTAENDLRHSEDLVNIIEIVLAFIGVLIAVFSVIGIIEIRKINEIRSQLTTELQKLRKDREQVISEIENLKQSSLDEGRALLKILFYISEGDNLFDKNPDEAIKLYERALKIRKDNPEIYHKLGITYILMGDYKKSIEFLRHGIDLAPNNTELIRQLARVYRKNQQYEEAKKLLEEFLKTNKEDPSILDEIGKIYLILKEYDKAKDKYTKYFGYKAGYYYAHFNLGFVYAGKGEVDDSSYHFGKALSLIADRLKTIDEGKPRIKNWFLRCKLLTLIGLSRFDEADEVTKELIENQIFPSEISFLIYRLNILYDVSKDERVKKMTELFESRL